MRQSQKSMLSSHLVEDEEEKDSDDDIIYNK